jgi:hypothetical protein
MVGDVRLFSSCRFLTCDRVERDVPLDSDPAGLPSTCDIEIGRGKWVDVEQKEEGKAGDAE